MPSSTEYRELLTPSQIVDASIQAFNDHDPNAFATYFSENVEVFEHPHLPKLRTRTDLHTSYANTFIATPRIMTTVLKRIAVGNCVVDHERVQRAPEDSPFDMIVINEIRNGLIERLYLVSNGD